MHYLQPAISLGVFVNYFVHGKTVLVTNKQANTKRTNRNHTRIFHSDKIHFSDDHYTSKCAVVKLVDETGAGKNESNAIDKVTQKSSIRTTYPKLWEQCNIPPVLTTDLHDVHIN